MKPYVNLSFNDENLEIIDDYIIILKNIYDKWKKDEQWLVNDKFFEIRNRDN